MAIQDDGPWTTGLTSVPIPSIVIRTMSPACRLKSSGGTMPGAGQQDDPARKTVVAAEPVDQLLEAAGHPRDAGFALENRGAVALDLHADADRRAGGIASASVMARAQAQHAS